jgi:hypothetical protein
MLHQTVQRLIVMVTFSAFIAAVIWLAAFMPSAHLANIDYARFWYVGERLLIAVAPALSPTDLHALAAWHPLDLLSQTAGFQVWLYPPNPEQSGDPFRDPSATRKPGGLGHHNGVIRRMAAASRRADRG